MVLAPDFSCPTKVYTQTPFVDVVCDHVDRRSWILVTSHGWLARGAVAKLADRAGKPDAMISDVRENPMLADVDRMIADIPNVDVIVALGGGSVIDAAKAVVAGIALRDADVSLAQHLVRGTALPDDFSPTPVIAVPTTAGTGSEVTRWATIWGEDKQKLSLSHANLFPAAAVLDPHLCLSMPNWLTLATGLDAISHAMESVWNKNHTPLTDRFAASAIETLYGDLKKAVDDPANFEVRRRVQVAATQAGMAISATKTALSHSISYPFTSFFGVPHGFACSFTLPEVSRFNLHEDSERLRPIANGLGCDVEEIPTVIDEWFGELDVGHYMADFFRGASLSKIEDHLITPARAGNNLRTVSISEAAALAEVSLKRFVAA